MLPISGRRVASLEVLADDDRKSGRLSPIPYPAVNTTGFVSVPAIGAPAGTDAA